MIKIIDKLILKNFAGPYIFSFFIAEFTLLMQFMWKWIDDILGKGVGMLEILELIGYHCLWTIPMALPVSILIASVMVYGDLAEKYELSSFKSAGVSLVRIMRPGLMMAVLTFALSLFASNYLVPVANFQFAKRFHAIKSQKSSLAIEEKIFNDDFDNFVIRVESKLPNGRDMKNVYIADQSKADRTMLNVILADSANMYVEPNTDLFIMKLHDGIIYQEEDRKWKNDRQTYPFIRTSFGYYSKVLDMSEFKLNNTLDMFRTKEDMMNSFQLLDAIDSLQVKKEYHEGTLNYDYAGVLKANYRLDSLDMYTKLVDQKSKAQVKMDTLVKESPGKSLVPDNLMQDARASLAAIPANETPNKINQKNIGDLSKYKTFYETLDSSTLAFMFYKVENQVVTRTDFSSNVLYNIQDTQNLKEKLKLKLHQQYAYAFICIIFLFIGAPLGSIIRKGGYGYPLLVAILFYMVFIISAIMGTKLLKTQTFGGVLSAWTSCLILAPFAIYFTIKALNDSRFDEASKFLLKMRNLLFKKKTVAISCFIFIALGLQSQQLTPMNIPFLSNGKELPLTPVGGLSAPQFMQIDFDRDGKKDLFIFDRNGNVPLAFINKGGPGAVNYIHDQRYIKNFPEIRIWCAAVDYDGDGIEDLFKFPSENNISGIEVWKGKLVDGFLQFDKVKNSRFNFDVLTVSLSNQTIPIYMSFIDYPAILDMDNDGDIDILTFESGGSYVEYYKNMATELGLPKDQFRYVLQDRCFGKFYEDQFSEKIKLSNSINNCATFSGVVSGNGSQRHSGSTIMAFDPNCDGKMDVILGDVGSQYMTFLKNTGVKDSAFITSVEERFPQSTESIKHFIFPSAFYLDINNDGKKDLLTTVNETSNSQTKNMIWYYENTGNGCEMKYILKSKNFLVDQMVDVGNSAHPLLFDYNGDGLEDIILGSNGEITDDGNRSNKLSLYINTGTKTKPQYTLNTENLLNVVGLNQIFTKLVPTAGDIDGDGDIDLIIGHSQGFMLYAENTGGKNNPPKFSNVKIDWLDIFAGQNASPTVIDFDNDGLLDLVVGKLNNNLNFYKNRGTKSSPSFMGFTPDETNLGGLFSGNNFDRQQGSPEFFKIKDQLYLLMGYSNGDISLYSVPDNNPKSKFTLLKSNILPFYLGRQVNPAIRDIDNDGFFELLVGNERGGLNVLKTDISTTDILSSTINFDDGGFGLIFYPNPTKEIVNVEGEWSGRIEVYDFYGRKVTEVEKEFEKLEINVGSLTAGVYFLKIANEHGVFSKKIVITH